jgi:hypothetical protein
MSKVVLNCMELVNIVFFAFNASEQSSKVMLHASLFERSLSQDFATDSVSGFILF